jgi:hypothetical protein
MDLALSGLLAYRGVRVRGRDDLRLRQLARRWYMMRVVTTLTMTLTCLAYYSGVARAEFYVSVCFDVVRLVYCIGLTQCFDLAFIVSLSTCPRMRRSMYVCGCYGALLLCLAGVASLLSFVLSATSFFTVVLCKQCLLRCPTAAIIALLYSAYNMATVVFTVYLLKRLIASIDHDPNQTAVVPPRQLIYLPSRSQNSATSADYNTIQFRMLHTVCENRRSASSMESGINETNICAICLDEFLVRQTYAILPCAHHYHVQCIMMWLEKSRQCPICKQRLCDATPTMVSGRMRATNSRAHI